MESIKYSLLAVNALIWLAKISPVDVCEVNTYHIDMLPEYSANGLAVPHLHITGIPIDDLASEPVVIEIDW